MCPREGEREPGAYKRRIQAWGQPWDKKTAPGREAGCRRGGGISVSEEAFLQDGGEFAGHRGDEGQVVVQCLAGLCVKEHGIKRSGLSRLWPGLSP